MTKSFYRRLLAGLLCLCLLPVSALAFNGDESPVTRSDFRFDLHVNADAFPSDGGGHYQAWEEYLSKIDVRGTADTQHWLSPYNRVYMEAGIYLDGENRLPFVYDGYMTYRYLISEALRGENIHFHMVNFFQFMLKGYYFMGLPTQYIALPMYPEAALELYQLYGEPIRRAVEGEGSRTVDFDTLYALCEELNLIAQEDENSKVYFFLTCLLLDLGLSDMLFDRLCYLEDWLYMLDPESEGLSIEVEGDTETWTIGGNTVYAKTADGWTVSLPDPDGYEYRVSWQTGEETQLVVSILMEESDYATLTMNAKDGRIDVTVTGDGFYEPVAPQSFVYAYENENGHVSLTFDWLHPETGKPAVGFTFEADQHEEPYTVLVKREYIKDDFFHLNESFMADYKQRYMKTLATAVLPFVLEMPAGVISDVVPFLNDTGVLAFLGIE